MEGRLDALPFPVYKKTTDLNPLVTMDFPVPIIWTSPLSFLGASGVCFHFYFIFQLKSYKQTE